MWKKKVANRRGPSLVGAKKYKKNPIARQAVRVGAQATKGVPELKYIDSLLALSAGVSSSAWTLGQLLNGCTRGDDITNRDGREIMLRSLMFRWTFQMSPTGTRGCNGRILVVYDRQANGGLSITDVLQNDSFYSMMNINNSDRFIILADVVTDPVGATANFSSSGKVYRKLNLVSKFNSNDTGTITDFVSGSIYLFACQDGGAAASAPQITIRTRVRFDEN